MTSDTDAGIGSAANPAQAGLPQKRSLFERLSRRVRNLPEGDTLVPVSGPVMLDGHHPNSLGRRTIQNGARGCAAGISSRPANNR